MIKTSISDSVQYKDICKRAYDNDVIFDNFKNDPVYKEILEHTSKEQGSKYIEHIKKSNPYLVENQEYVDKIKLNDSVGNPVEYLYDGLSISPSTLRYTKVVSDLIGFYNNLNGLDIIEIGVGYGGQSLLISKLFDIKSYTMVDLREVLDLSKKYVSNFDEVDKYNFYTQDELPEKNYDLVISNYAFSECTKETQDIYIDNILNKSEHGYMTNNKISHIFNIQSYDVSELMERINKDVDYYVETPNTHKDNYLLVW